MEKITSESLSKKAADALRNLIITGKLVQGQKITEDECCELLGVSRVCIREAFFTLQAEGLLVKETNKKTTVRKFSVKDIEDIYYMRYAIERMCIQYCLDHRILPVDKLEQILKKMYAVSEKKKLAPMEMTLVDLQFHSAIIEASGNLCALKTWNSLKAQIETVLFPVHEYFASIQERDMNPSRHAKFLESLQSGNDSAWMEELEYQLFNSVDIIKNLIKE